MFEWISQLPLWLQIIIAIVLIGSIIHILISTIRRGIQITKGNLTIRVDGEKRGEYVSPHVRCPHSKDIVILLNEVQKVLDRKYILIHKEQTQMQMNYAEQKCDELRMTFQKFVIEELEKNITNAEILQLNVIIIKLMFKEIENYILTIFRSAFRMNHFDEMNEKEFNTYVEEKSLYIIAQIQNFLFDLQIYADGAMTKLIKLIAINSTAINVKIQNAVTDIFQYARTLAIDNKIKLMSYDEEIDRILKKYI